MLDVAETITLLQQWCRCEIKMFPAIQWWFFCRIVLFRILVPRTYCNMMQYDLLTWDVFLFRYSLGVIWPSWSTSVVVRTVVSHFGWIKQCKCMVILRISPYHSAFLGVVIEWPLYSSLQIQFGYIQILTSDSQWTYCSLLAMVGGYSPQSVRTTSRGFIVTLGSFCWWLRNCAGVEGWRTFLLLRNSFVHLTDCIITKTMHVWYVRQHLVSFQLDESIQSAWLISVVILIVL